MLQLNEILAGYPPAIQVHRSFILREYLQYKILELLFEGKYARHFCFLGGTCLRLVHNNTRFSEDLDFDNFSVDESMFGDVSESIKTGLERQGYTVEIKQVIRGAYHCYIRFPGLLFEQGLSGYKEEKILIQLDTEPQHFDFKPDSFILNKFDVTTRIYTTPPSLLLAQKFAALCLRKKSKGRDFFDIAFLLSRNIKPDYEYLAMKLDAPDPLKLRERVADLLFRTDLEEMVKDVQIFLMNPAEEKRIRLFPDLFAQADIG
jgi:predicted nucleotidyltransferase component of viral defense system